MWQRSCPMWLILSINIPFIHGRFSFTCTTAVWFQEREFQIWPTVTKAISVISDSEKAEQLQSRSLKYFTFLFWVWISLFVSGDFPLAECPVHRVAHRATGFECNLLHLCVGACVYALVNESSNIKALDYTSVTSVEPVIDLTVIFLKESHHWDHQTLLFDTDLGFVFY